MTVTVMASASGVFVPILLDEQDADALPGKLSIGSHGYAQGMFDGRFGLLHRWILGLERGDPRKGDHVNGKPFDNRRSNLRIVDASGSSSNVKGRGKSGYRGVYPCRGKWQARGKLDGRMYHLGTYDTPEAAHTIASAWRSANLPGYVSRAGT